MKRFYSRLNNFTVRPRARQRILSPSAMPNPNVPMSLSLNGLLQEPTLVISRQIEYANLLLGYEQANKYSIRSTTDQQLALMCEQGEFLKTVLARQILRTRRPMEVDIVNNTGEMLMKIQRPLQWFLNSHLTVYDHHGVPLGVLHINAGVQI